ncbi:MAG: hypothetical protein AMJ88_12780 [Anaerolineae bacterium SM23_ 63]|nr:MAG: hypothetical protein AMJ88_12780 [Anaerolineae bacterium SM23_ 63]HEY45423.1 hypothetical protein [Anaerolineae bacterium]
MRSPLSLLFVWTLLGAAAVFLAVIALRRSTRGNPRQQRGSGNVLASGVNFLVITAVVLWVILILLYILLR